jgi:hypothetical protein
MRAADGRRTRLDPRLGDGLARDENGDGGLAGRLHRLHGRTLRANEREVGEIHVLARSRSCLASRGSPLGTVTTTAMPAWGAIMLALSALSVLRRPELNAQ